jgi:hypothetical protein
MNLPSNRTILLRMLKARLAQATPRCAPLAASLGRNAAGGAHLTLQQAGKTRTVYVPRELTEEVQTSIQEHKRLKKLLGEMTQLQLALIQGHCQHQKRRKPSL